MTLPSLITTYEQAERDLLCSLARPSDVFYDVGAYVGWYSVALAPHVRRVCAFEPIPDICEELLRNIDELPNVYVYMMGLSDSVGVANFHISSREPGTGSLAPLEEERFGVNTIQRRRVSTIDLLCTNRLPPPSLIKIDVEGAELRVLKGAAQTISSYHPIIQCEMLRKWSRRFDYHPNDIIAFLSGFGYRCYCLRAGRLDRFHLMTDETAERNFFFIHPDQADRISQLGSCQ